MALFGWKKEPTEEQRRYIQARFEAEAEVLREMMTQWKNGNDDYLKDLLRRGGAPPEIAEDVTELRKSIPWKVYWGLRVLKGADVVSAEEVDAAWDNCLSYYGSVGCAGSRQCPAFRKHAQRLRRSGPAFLAVAKVMCPHRLDAHMHSCIAAMVVSFGSPNSSGLIPAFSISSCQQAQKR